MKNPCYPNYSRIYSDLIDRKCPEKKARCIWLLSKEKLTAMEVLKLESYIFGENSSETLAINKFKSYDQESIKMMLEYQIKNKLNNTQTANHFKISRNTLAKWKNSIKFK